MTVIVVREATADTDAVATAAPVQTFALVKTQRALFSTDNALIVPEGWVPAVGTYETVIGISMVVRTTLPAETVGTGISMVVTIPTLMLVTDELWSKREVNKPLIVTGMSVWATTKDEARRIAKVEKRMLE